MSYYLTFLRPGAGVKRAIAPKCSESEMSREKNVAGDIIPGPIRASDVVDGPAFRGCCCFQTILSHSESHHKQPGQ